MGPWTGRLAERTPPARSPVPGRKVTHQQKWSQLPDSVVIQRAFHSSLRRHGCREQPGCRLPPWALVGASGPSYYGSFWSKTLKTFCWEVHVKG